MDTEENKFQIINKETTKCGIEKITVNRTCLKKYLSHLKNSAEFDANILLSVMATENQDNIEIDYNLISEKLNTNIIVSVILDGNNPVCDSVVDLYKSANYEEREIYDLFGVYFEGNKDLKRLLLPESTVGNPLRKDYICDNKFQKILVKNFSDTILNIENPCIHGIMKLIAKINNETIKSAEPVIGYCHKGIEKMAESKNYLQYLPITDKIDYLSGLFYQEAYCSALEKLCDIEVPQRAQYIRVMLMELNRISSHLKWLGQYLDNLGSIAPKIVINKEREIILDIFSKISGQRNMSNYYTFGGVKYDLDNSILNKIGDFVSIFPQKVKEYQNLITDNPIFISRTKNIGIITKNQTRAYSLSGANMRASGISTDIRKIKPYLVYDNIEFDIPTDTDSDCYSRCLIRIREMIESLKIIRQCNRFLIKTSGEYKNSNVNPIQIHPNEDMAVSYVESPRGIVSCTVISDGTDKPIRVKWRTPSYYSIQFLSEILKNKNITDIYAIIGSLDIITSEADR